MEGLAVPPADRSVLPYSFAFETAVPSLTVGVLPYIADGICGVWEAKFDRPYSLMGR